MSEAEQELGVVFPAAYRDYLLRVSAGGKVATLAKTDEGWWWEGNDTWRRADLTVPFPHPDSYFDAEVALDAREPLAADFPDEASFKAAWQAWDDEYGIHQDHKTAGAIMIVEHGCNYAEYLAITGPLAGTVWWDGRASCDMIEMLSLDHAGDAQPVTFDQWLEHDSANLLPPGWGRTADTPVNSPSPAGLPWGDPRRRRG